MIKAKWVNSGGKVIEEGGVLRSSGGAAYMFTEENIPMNFVLETEIYLEKEGEAGVYFRTVAKNGIEWLVGYYFSVNVADHSIKLSKVNGGDNDNKVLGCVHYPFKTNQWYKIRIEMYEKNTRIWFNNFLLDTQPYPKFDLSLGYFMRGCVGLSFGDGVAQFKPVSLTENTNKPLSPEVSFTNPILYGADPEIMYHDGMYYLYYTDTADMTLFQCYTSRDLLNWSEPHVVFHGRDGWGNNEYMSPNVIYKDGWFYMFYASHTARDANGKRRAQVTYAVSKSPLGPFKSEKKQPLHTEVQEIGGAPFVDDNGRYYITVVRFNNGNEVWAMEIRLENGEVIVLEDTVTKLFEATDPWEKDYANIVEGAIIIKHKGLYYAMYAGSHYKGSYAEGYAIAESPLGPYKKYAYNPILTSHVQARAVGDSVYVRTPSGEYVMFYHQHYSPTEISPRWMRMDRMKFVEVEDGPDVMVVNGPTMTPQAAIDLGAPKAKK